MSNYICVQNINVKFFVFQAIKKVKSDKNLELNIINTQELFPIILKVSISDFEFENAELHGAQRFSEVCTYPAHLFRRRQPMRRDLLVRILEGCMRGQLPIFLLVRVMLTDWFQCISRNIDDNESDSYGIHIKKYRQPITLTSIFALEKTLPSRIHDRVFGDND